MSRLAIAAAVAALLALLALFLAARFHNQQQYSGDEPHYFVLANSLIQDGDVDIKNDYEAGRFLRYHADPIDPHVNFAIFSGESPHWYSIHGVGLPALIVPALAIADTNGASVELTLFAVAAVALAFLWARCFSVRAWPATFAAVAIGVSPFFLGLEGRIFPDLATAALLVACLLLMELPAPRPWQALILGVLVGVAPWLHLKNGLPFATIAVVAAVQIWRGTSARQRTTALLLLAAPVVGSAVGYEVALHAWYGSWSPTRMLPPGNEAFRLSEARAMSAVSFDAARGLLANNPALLLILPGLPVWFRLYRGAFLRVALVLTPALLFQATFHDWSGGFSPAGRYALQFVPALAPAIALFIREAPTWARAVAGLLLAYQLALSAAFVWLRPSWGFAGIRSPFLQAIDDRVGPSLDRVMPVFDFDGRLLHGGDWLAGWIALAVLLVAYGFWLSGTGRTTPAASRTA